MKLRFVSEIAIFVRDENREKSSRKSNMKSLATKLEFLRGLLKLAVWDGSFLMVYRTNACRLGADSISVCLETHWLGHFMSRDATVMVIG